MAGGEAGMGLGCVLMAREYVDSGMGVRRAENEFRISEFRMGLWKIGKQLAENRGAAGAIGPLHG